MSMATAERFGAYDFGLTTEQEERAALLHRESIICDMLFQGPCGYRSFTDEMDAALTAEFEHHHSDLQYVYSAIAMPLLRALKGEFPEYETCWTASGITAANRQVSTGADARALWGWALHARQFDLFPWLARAVTGADIRRAKAEGRAAGYISSQNTTEMGEDLKLLDALHMLGLRMLQLTYNSMNFVGAGCTERVDAGISHFGSRLIVRMNELGIIVDTGHCGRQTTLDACALSERPVVASHTSIASVYQIDRAKSDDELRAIAASGGVIGICAVPFFLAPGSDVTIEAMLDQIDYAVTLAGWEHVGIGTDWPLQASKQAVRHLDVGGAEIGFRAEHNLDSATNLIGFDDYRDFPNITRGLVKRGYRDEQIRGILGENFLRVFEQVCG
jgi:membrane dipeptidase